MATGGMTFTESSLRRAISDAKGRELALHLCGGSVVRGIVADVDATHDGFIELTLDYGDRRVRFVAPVENIVAYEAATDGA